MITLSEKSLFILDPYYKGHEKLFSSHEDILNYINSIKSNKSKEEYINSKKKTNEIEEFAFIKDKDKIKDFCHIQGEKDIKICRITFPNLGLKKRPLIDLACGYAEINLGMEEVFIKINPNDKDIIKILEAGGYESLGEEDGSIIYLKERELEVNKQRVV